MSGVAGAFNGDIHRSDCSTASAIYSFGGVPAGTYLLYESFPCYPSSGKLAITAAVVPDSDYSSVTLATKQDAGSTYEACGVTWYSFAEVTLTSQRTIKVTVGTADCCVITDAVMLARISGNLLVDSDNDDPHGAIDRDRPQATTLEDQVADEAPGKYIAVQANDAGGNPLTSTSFVPMKVNVNSFLPGVTEIRFVANQIDLNDNTCYDASILALHSQGPEYNSNNDIGFVNPAHATGANEYTVYTADCCSPAGFRCGSFYLCSGMLTIYVQALEEGMADIELQVDPDPAVDNGHWITVDTVRFTALDTNVGSPSGVSVTPAGFLAVNEDPLGVGSSVFMTFGRSGGGGDRPARPLGVDGQRRGGHPERPG